MTQNNKGLYIHIPFCKSKCPYCDFYSVKFDSETAENYKTALIDEIKNGNRCSEFTNNEKFTFNTVYFGGGTPSLFGGERISEIISAVKENHTVTHNAEITVECNPSSCGDKLFKALKTAGVNRISLGMQSFNDNERRKLGRTADSETVKNAVISAKQNGFSNISLDIMLGIELQTIESLDKTIDFCLSLDIPHISAYILKIEENTVFAKRQNLMNLPNEDEICDLYLHLVKRLKQNGIMQYEISNFARHGYESRHNVKYWDCKEYLGLGAAAHSFINGKRFYFDRNINSFIKGEKAVFDCYGGDENEYIMLKLRLAKGLNFNDFQKRFSHPLNKNTIKKAETLQKYELVNLTENTISLTEKGFLLSNSVISELTEF